MSETQAEYQVKELVDRRWELESLVDIPDFVVYAEGWRKLAADFRAVGAYANAARCDAKAEHYQENKE